MSETPAAPVRGATIHPAVAWPFIVTTVVFIAGWLYAYAGAAVFSPWWLLGAVPVLAVLGRMVLATHWDEADYGVAHARSATWLARVAGLGAGCWLTWSGWAGPGQALPLLVLGALPLWAWFAVLSWRAPRQAAVMQERYDQGRVIVRDRSWRLILDKAGCDDVVITDVREHRGGMVLTVEPDPERDKAPTFDMFAARAKAIGTAAAMHYRRTGTPLPRNAVRPEEGDDDAQFLLNISMRDVFAEATTYVPDYAPGDIARALDIGEYEDASRILLSIVGHMKIVGMTGAGKSVVANNLIARITACSNALVWAGGTDKLIPLVWPWLKSWFDGRACRPVLDFVAGNSVHDVLRMLRAAYRLACERNDRLTDESKMRATASEPAVFVFLEETSHAIEFQDTVTTHDGQEVTVSDLLKMVAQNGRSANVWLILLSQYGINPALGDRASELIRNLTMRICLRTMESHDGYRTLPGLPATVDTASMPLHTMFVQPSIEVARAVPGKAAELDGTAQIDPIAVRQAGWRADGVEDESDLGEDYAGRWDAERLPELARAVARAGLAWRVPGTVVMERDDQPRGHGGEGEPVEDDGVDTQEDGAWTEADDDALRRFIGGHGDPDGSAGTARPFELPDGTDRLKRLQRMADELGTPPTDQPGTGEPPDRAEAYRSGEPVPEPLRAVVEWLERTGWAVDGWVRTEELAEGIGWPGPAGSLGRTLSRVHEMLRTRNVPRAYDPRQRNGYPVRLLREVADRFRFGMP